MITLILKMLEIDEHLAVSEEVDIAKGMYKTPLTIREGLAINKRNKAWLSQRK